MPGCGLVPEFPYSACYRTLKCNLLSPNWKNDPHRAYFCRKFGQNQPQICPEVFDPCESIHEPLRALDYFSSPPMYRRAACIPKFRYKKSEPDPCAETCKLSCSCCPGIPQLPCCYCKPNPKPYGDAVCGLCQVTESPSLNALHTGSIHSGNSLSVNRASCPDFGDLPFTVEFTDPNANKGPIFPKSRSQVERCIQTSQERYLDTVYNDEFQDFYKIKSKEHISLYRTQLAIEKRRPGLTIPADSSGGDKVLDMSQPIYINAKVIRMKNKGKAPTKSYQVCVPGPITIG